MKADPKELSPRKVLAEVAAAIPADVHSNIIIIGIEGFSGLNVWRMRAFFLAWQAPDLILSQLATELKEPPAARSSSEPLSQPATEIDPSFSSPILAQAVQELPPPEILSLPWFHNVVLIHKVKDPATRLWYAAKTLENGWSRSILTLQIESAAHKRHGKAITNFKHTLPDPQSDLAQQIVKDLFHQTVSMKSVGNLTDFIRGHMLEPFDVESRICAPLRLPRQARTHPRPFPRSRLRHCSGTPRPRSHTGFRSIRRSRSSRRTRLYYRE